MLSNYLPFLLTNFFWVSLVFIGYASIRFLSESNISPRKLQLLLRKVLKQHAFIVFFASTVGGFGFFAPLVAVAYMIHAPVMLLVILYILLTTGSVCYIGYKSWSFLLSSSKSDPLRWTGQINIVKWISIALLIALILDFYVATLLNGHAASGSDTYYHLTRITNILSESFFNIDSGFYLGVPDASYQANLLYALYTIPTTLFNLAPIDVWSDSFGFFRLIQWMAIFAVAYVVFRRWMSTKNALIWTNLAVLITIPLFSNFFYIASYPNQVVIAWIIAFIILLLLYVEKSSRLYVYGLYGVAFLITTTHPTYALMTAVFVVYWYILHILLYRLKSVKDYMKSSWMLLPIVLVLMIGPLISKSMPSYITPEQQTITASSVTNLPLGMSILDLQTLLPESRLQLLTLILSIVGFIYIFLKWRKKKKESISILIALVTFSIVILYVPPVFTILKAALPVWVIQRFIAMDILQFIFPIAGLLAFILIAGGIIEKFSLLRLSNRKEEVTILLFAIATITVGCTIGISSYRHLADSKSGNPEAYQYADKIKNDISLKNLQLRGATVLADDRVSYTLPAIVGVNVIALEMGHSTTAADTKHRIQCKNELLRSLRYDDLKFVKVDFILLSKFDSNINELRQLIKTRPYIEEVTTIADLTVYKFNTKSEMVDKSSVYSSCVKYSATENGNR